MGATRNPPALPSAGALAFTGFELLKTLTARLAELMHRAPVETAFREASTSSAFFF